MNKLLISILFLLSAASALANKLTLVCFRNTPADPWVELWASPESRRNMLAAKPPRAFDITPETPCPPVTTPPQPPQPLLPPDQPCVNCPVPDPTPVTGSPYSDCRELVGHSVEPGAFEVANYGKRLATCDGVTIFQNTVHAFAHSGGVTRIKCTGEALDVRGLQHLFHGEGSAGIEEMSERKCK